jgi:hypothetical protein
MSTCQVSQEQGLSGEAPGTLRLDTQGRVASIINTFLVKRLLLHLTQTLQIRIPAEMRNVKAQVLGYGLVRRET